MKREKETAPILVLGATGSAGRRVASRLRAAGAPVRAASRSGDTRFDWHDEETWEPALRGVRRMFLMAPDGVGVNPALVGLAAEAGVAHIVLLSSRAIEVMDDRRLLEAEKTVKESGTGWTVLRSDWFDQNFDEGPFREAVFAGELAVPLGDCGQTFVDLGDVAEVAARALTEEGHTGRTYEVTGPESLSFREVCAVIGEASGRRLDFHGDPASYRSSQRELGRPEEEVEQDLAAFAALRRLGDAEPLDTVERVTGRPPRRFAEYAAAAADRWREPSSGTG
ncbi:NmrA family NAD(P)-binding protein [Streptomyces zingiberis]|uniref:NAD(P)H-binding protein n=1 Tax=Streptomyces zingiberis TaxID=2053010 RepID=A0ABX1C1Q6_9ACTN|nr:NmrA family NAD(P)-binding protein [Streptomyces zingiberis]NJQ03825.1 NAD(P)H-binding protein [Streptomyces zingiberis]